MAKHLVLRSIGKTRDGQNVIHEMDATIMAPALAAGGHDRVWQIIAAERNVFGAVEWSDPILVTVDRP